MGSPVRIPHANFQSILITWGTTYAIHCPGTQSLDNGSLRLDLENVPQPDFMLRIAGASTATSKAIADEYVEGPPELVAEVAVSSASYDMHEKLRVYRRNGVREYLVWRVLDRAIDWFSLQSGQYVPIPVGEENIVKSEIFPGLWLDRTAILNGDYMKVLSVLQQGMATPECRAFVEKLAALKPA